MIIIIYKKCVTLEDVERTGTNCKIKYRLEDKSLTYNLNIIGKYKTIIISEGKTH